MGLGPLLKHSGSAKPNHIRNLTATLCLTLTILRGSAGMSANVVFQKGLSAYGKDDYATAAREWKPLAAKGMS